MEAEVSVDADRDVPPKRGLMEELAAVGLCTDTLAALGPAVAVTRVVQYAPGDTLFHHGQDVETLYVVRNGRIKLLSYVESGRARIVRLHNRGSILGLNGLVGEVHTHTAVAIDEVHVFQMPMSVIKPLKEEDPDTYCQLLERWHEYLNMADTWILDFSTGVIRGRVARLIRFLVETDEDTGPKEVVLLTVEEMAEILGVTPESVSRIMADLKRKKILQVVEHGAHDQYRCDISALAREAEQ